MQVLKCKNDRQHGPVHFSQKIYLLFKISCFELSLSFYGSISEGLSYLAPEIFQFSTDCQLGNDLQLATNNRIYSFADDIALYPSLSINGSVSITN